MSRSTPQGGVLLGEEERKVSKDTLPHRGRRLTATGKAAITLVLSFTLLGLLTIVAPAAQRTTERTVPTGTTTFDPTTFDPTTFDPTTFDPTTFDPTTFDPTTFDPPAINKVLDVNIKGPGKVTVGGLACGETDINRPNTAASVRACGKTFSAATTFNVTATKLTNDDAQFVRWETDATTCNLSTAATCGVAVTTVDRTITAIFQDNTDPVASIAGGTANSVVTSDTGSFSISFTGSNAADPPVTTQCAVQTGTFAPCSAFALTSPPDGLRTLKLKSTDPSGNVADVEKALNFFTLPQSTITGGPTGLVNSSTAEFGLTASKAGATVLCKLDAATSFTACPANGHFTGLSQGVRTLQTRAQQDYEGLARVEESLPSRTWTVDTVAPDTTLTEGPQDGLLTNLAATVFAFTSEAGATFQCSVDGAAFGSCPGSVPGRASFSAAPGARTFAVRARDVAGNVDPSPAARAWTVTADLDGDGHVVPADCDDSNATIHPGATDIPSNGVDEDCSGADASPPPVILTDADGDGHVVPADCNDANAGINPGAVDVPDNGVDEDCKGGDAVGPVPAALVSFNFRATGAFTTLKTLALKALPAGSTVTVTCKHPKGTKAGKCPKKLVKQNVSGTFNLKSFTKRKIRAGSVLEIRVSRSGMTTLVKILKLRPRKSPQVTTKCVRNGQSTPTACPG